MAALDLTSASSRRMSLLLKCVPVLAFLVSIGVVQNTVSVGPIRAPYPGFKDIQFDLLFKKIIHSLTHSCINVVMHVFCRVRVMNKTKPLSAFMELQSYWEKYTINKQKDQ